MSTVAARPDPSPKRPSPSRDRPLPADPVELEKVIRAQQNQLASSVNALTDHLAPKNIIARVRADLEAKGRAAVFTEDGELRVERVVAGGSSVVALVGLLLWRRGRRKARRRYQHRSWSEVS